MEMQRPSFHTEITDSILRCVIAVHKELGPALAESACYSTSTWRRLATPASRDFNFEPLYFVSGFCVSVLL